MIPLLALFLLSQSKASPKPPTRAMSRPAAQPKPQAKGGASGFVSTVAHDVEQYAPVAEKALSALSDLFG